MQENKYKRTHETDTRQGVTELAGIRITVYSGNIIINRDALTHRRVYENERQYTIEAYAFNYKARLTGITW